MTDTFEDSVISFEFVKFQSMSSEVFFMLIIDCQLVLDVIWYEAIQEFKA